MFALNTRPGHCLPFQSICFFSMARNFLHEHNANKTTRTSAAIARRNALACLTAISFSSWLDKSVSRDRIGESLSCAEPEYRGIKVMLTKVN